MAEAYGAAFGAAGGWSHGAGLTPPGWEAFLALSRRKVWSAKQVVYREGEPAQGVLAVRRGLLKLVAHAPDGRMRIVRLHGAGALVGLGGLLDPVREHTAVAVDEVEADCVALAAVARLGRDCPALYCRLLESGYAQLRSADRWLTEFSTGSVRARVARLVNFLGTLQSEGAALEVELLSCEDMAAILGVTVESVSRVLAEFKRERWLRAVCRAPAKRYRRDAGALQRIAQA